MIDSGPSVWAGPECSHLRIDERWCDELTLTGHRRRLADIERLASLGVSAVRYPVLWGWPSGGPETNWSWAAPRLRRLGELGIRPIVGLLHHGEGPTGSSLVDPDFPVRFAAYARDVARRFPEVDAYLPINEPLTTA